MAFLVYDIFSILPEIYLLVSISCLLVYTTFFSTANSFGFPLFNVNTAWLSLQIIVISLLLIYFMFPFYLYTYNQLLITNFFVKNIRLFITILFIFFFLFSFSYTKNENINSFEFWILSLLSVVGMLLTVQVNDLFSMYITIELQSLAYYTLASFKRTSEFSTEAGLKYFILGAFSSILLLFGFSILYSLTGLTNFNDCYNFFSGFSLILNSFNLGIVLSLILIASALLFKLTAAPFHMWAPDVYEGSIYPITLFFSTLPKFTILVLFLRFFILTFYDFFYMWQPIILLCTYFSVMIGTFGAFIQNKIKRFLAYSSINHVGFMLVGFNINELSGNFGLLFYTLSYVVMTFSIFLFILVLRYCKYPKFYRIRYIENLKGLSETNFILSWSLALILFSMVGIPPLIGFFAKTFIFFSCLQLHMNGLVIFLIITSCITCFYYIRFIKLMYFDETKNQLVFCYITKFDSLFLGLFTFLTLFSFLSLESFSLFITRLTLFLVS